MSDRHLFFALTNVVEGRHAEFNRWYNEEHVPDILKIPGFKTAQRYRLNPEQRSPSPGYEAQRKPPYEYLTIYEIEGDDLAALHERVVSTKHQRRQTDALAPDHQAWVWTAIGEPVHAEDVAPQANATETS